MSENADGVDKEIERAPFLLDRGKDGVDRCDVLDVAGQEKVGAERCGQRLHALAERFALIGEGELGALRGQRAAMPQAIE